MKKMNKAKFQKKQLILFIIGGVLFITGLSIISFYGVRKICRDINRQKMMKENVVIEISDLKIKAPVLEGTGNDILAKAVGHFENTGTVGHGNYCIAGHSSVIYKEYFNELKNAQIGMEINLYDISKKCYVYKVAEMFIVEPNEVWILNDFGDNRLTLVTCTDDGLQRQIIVAKME